MAQRLVRRLDDETKIAYQPDQATLAYIKRVLDTLPSNVERPSIEGLTLYKAGSSASNPYGYRGQLPLREQFMMNGRVKDLLQNNSQTITTEQLEAAASTSGMRTMLQNGVLKVLAGETTLEELYRVIG